MRKKGGLPFAFFSIRTKFTLVCSALVLCVILICMIMFNSFHEILRVNTSQSIANVIERIKMNVELFINEVDANAISVLHTRPVQRLITNGDEASVAQTNELLLSVQSDISRVVGADVNLSLLSSQMRILSSSYPGWVDKQRVLGTHWIDKINRAGGEKVIISGYTVSDSMLRQNMKIISIARRVLTEDGQQKFYLLIDIPIESIQRLCANGDLSSNGFVTMMDDDGFILYHTDESQIGARFRQTPLLAEDSSGYSIATINRTEMLICRRQTDYSGYTVLGAEPTNDIYHQLNTIQSRFLMMMGLLLMLSILAVYLVTHGITSPIRRMRREMQRVEQGDFSPYKFPERHDEIGALEKNFNTMLVKLNELIDHVYRATLREREAEYKALSASIRPHFLYNTLEAIALTAYMNNDPQTMDMLNLLADLFRFSTRSTSRLVRLEQECEHAKVYLQIVQMRNPGQFETSWEIPPSLMNKMVPGMILQPLVENAVQYAFRDVESGGALRISAGIETNRLVITVRDNGEGMPPQQLEELRRLLYVDRPETGMMALKNINDRIQLSLGTQYGLTLNADEKGFCVTMQLPVLEDESNDESIDRG